MMLTDQEIRVRYADIFDSSDDAAFIRIAGDLEAALPLTSPPDWVYTRLSSAVAREQHTRRGGPRILPGLWAAIGRRGRVAVAAVALAGAAIGLGANGPASAAVNGIVTRLFSSPPSPTRSALWVGTLAVPLTGGCTPRPASSPVVSPDQRRVGELRDVPAGFSASVAAIFPPCRATLPLPGAAPPPQQPANLAWENVTTTSIIRYTGDEGTLYVATARATDEGTRRGLYLGNPDGTLSDGTALWILGKEVRFVRDGLIIDLWGDTPTSRLNQLAGDVVVR